jgi:hypothetical protein
MIGGTPCDLLTSLQYGKGTRCILVRVKIPRCSYRPVEYSSIWDAGGGRIPGAVRGARGSWSRHFDCFVQDHHRCLPSSQTRGRISRKLFKVDMLLRDMASLAGGGCWCVSCFPDGCIVVCYWSISTALRRQSPHTLCNIISREATSPGNSTCIPVHNL